MTAKEVNTIVPVLQNIDKQLKLMKKYREDKFNGTKTLKESFKYAVCKGTNKYISACLEAIAIDPDDKKLVCRYSYSIYKALYN
jgi:hypothetical protein